MMFMMFMMFMMLENGLNVWVGKVQLECLGFLFYERPRGVGMDRYRANADSCLAFDPCRDPKGKQAKESEMQRTTVATLEQIVIHPRDLSTSHKPSADGGGSRCEPDNPSLTCLEVSLPPSHGV